MDVSFCAINYFEWFWFPLDISANGRCDKNPGLFGHNTFCKHDIETMGAVLLQREDRFVFPVRKDGFYSTLLAAESAGGVRYSRCLIQTILKIDP